jgi:hypothetical protein
MAHQHNTISFGTGNNNDNGGDGTPINSDLRNRQIIAYSNDPAANMAAIRGAVLDPRNDVEFEGLHDEVYSTTAIRITVTLPEPILPRFPPGPPPPYTPSDVPPYSLRSTSSGSSTRVGRDSSASEQDDAPETTTTTSGNTMVSDNAPASPERSADTTPSQLEASRQQPAPASTAPESDVSETTASISENTIAGNTVALDDMPARLDRSTDATPSQLEAGLQQHAPVIAVPQSDAPVATSEPTHVVPETTIRHHTFQQGNSPWRLLGLDVFSQNFKATLRFLSWKRASPSRKSSIGLLILVALGVVACAALAVSRKIESDESKS